MAGKLKKMRDKSSEELVTEVRQLREQLFKLRWQAAGGKVENPSKIGAVRRDIARHLTVIREREASGGESS